MGFLPWQPGIDRPHKTIDLGVLCNVVLSHDCSTTCDCFGERAFRPRFCNAMVAMLLPFCVFRIFSHSLPLVHGLWDWWEAQHIMETEDESKVAIQADFCKNKVSIYIFTSPLPSICCRERSSRSMGRPSHPLFFYLHFSLSLSFCDSWTQLERQPSSHQYLSFSQTIKSIYFSSVPRLTSPPITSSILLVPESGSLNIHPLCGLFGQHSLHIPGTYDSTGLPILKTSPTCSQRILSEEY